MTPGSGLTALHICLAAAHRLVELRLGEVECGFQSCLIFRCACQQGWCGAGQLALENHQALTGFVAGHAQQIRLARVEILCIARIPNPDRLAFAQHPGEPIHFAQQIFQSLGIGGLGKEKPLLPAAVIARGYGDGLAVARFDEFQLAVISAKVSVTEAASLA
jgi:hypothetical protein